MPYEIIWSSRWDQGRKVVESAAMVDAWVSEFRDRGADAIKVLADGCLIDLAELPELIKQETRAASGSSNA